MELETYEVPELVELGSADELVQYYWSGNVQDTFYGRYECSCEC